MFVKAELFHFLLYLNGTRLVKGIRLDNLHFVTFIHDGQLNFISLSLSASSEPFLVLFAYNLPEFQFIS